MSGIDQRPSNASGPLRGWRTSSVQSRPARAAQPHLSPSDQARALAPESAGWMRKGACVDLPVEQQRWFVADDAKTQKQAVEICNSQCSVRQPCAEHAIRSREQTGVWGGLTPAQRTRRREKGRGRGR